MYLEIFGLRRLPFRLRPDPTFWHADAAIRRTHDRLRDALQRANGRCVVSGEAGVGKSLLGEIVLGEIAEPRPIIRVHQPEMSANELTEAIALQLGATPGVGRRGPPDLRSVFDGGDAGGPAPLLLIDHAQLLATPALQALGECASADARCAMLLIAREDFGASAPWGASLGFARRLEILRLRPFDAAGVETYVETRLRAAGAARRGLFTPEACERLFVETRGVPRAINVLGDLALSVAAARRVDRVGAAEIVEATRDPRWIEPRAAGPRSAPTSADAAPALPLHVAAPQAIACGRIVVLKDAREIADLALVPGRLQIGRATDNDLPLPSRYVSRRHCELVTVTDGPRTRTTLVDLGSRNGTLVNGRRIKRHRLSPGDVVQVGDHELRCVGPASEDQAPPT